MNCPQCQRDIPAQTIHCPDCGFYLPGKSLNKLRDEITKLNEDAAVLSDRTKRALQHVDALEKLFSGPAIKKPDVEKADHTEKVQDMAREGSAGDERTAPEQIIESEKPDGEQTRREPPPFPRYKVPPPPRKKKEKTVREPGAFEVQFGQKWPLIAGVVIVVLAVGYFLKYSFDQNWVGPAGRVTMAYMLGIGFLVVGEFFRRKDLENFGLSLCGGGIATLYFATFAGFQIYDLFSQPVSFLGMVLITLLAGMLAYVYDTKWLAVLGIIGGFLTPVVLSTGTNAQITLMTYMTILNIGIFSLAFFKQWRLLNYLGFFFTWSLFSAWFLNHYHKDDFWVTFFFLNVFFLIYAFTPIVYHFIKAHGQKIRGLAIIMPNSFIAFGFSFGMIKEYAGTEYVSIVSIMYAGMFLWMANYLYRKDRSQLQAFIMLLAKGMLFLIITIPVLFSGHWITFFWSIQCVVLLWAATKLNNRWLYSSFLVLLIITSGKFFMYDYHEIFRFSYNNYKFIRGFNYHLGERLLTIVFYLATLFISAKLVNGSKLRFRWTGGMDAPILWGVFGVTLFTILNFEVSGFYSDYSPQARFAALSVLWTIFSLVLIIIGFMKRLSFVRKCAIALFTLTILKVLIIDMANVSTPYRIVSCFVLGMMLIGTSYLYHHFKEQILPPEREGKEQ